MKLPLAEELDGSKGQTLDDRGHVNIYLHVIYKLYVMHIYIN